MKNPRSEDQPPATAAEQEPAEVTSPARPPDADAAGRQRGMWEIEGRGRNIRLEPGLHALIVGQCTATRDRLAGLSLPMTQVMPPPGASASIAIVSNSGGDGGWVGVGGGTVILRATGGAAVFVVTYGVTDEAALPELRLVNLDRLADSPAPPAAPVRDIPAALSGREIPRELTLHIERQGDRRFSALDWAGTPGDRLRIEGFAIRPLEAIAPGHIEYMAFGPGGRQTPWVSDARLCGTRGRGLPLTGFAVRLAPALRERFDVEYEGYFFESGPRGPQRNGEPCLPSVGDDPLGAIRLRLIERAGA